MTWYPHSTVAVIVEKDGKFLIVEEESSGKVVYNQPAGHVEQNESLISAAKREAFEETAWHVEPSYIVGFYSTIGQNNVTYHRFCFAAHAVSFDQEQTLDNGIIRAVWLTRDELAADTTKLRSPMVLKCIDDYLTGNKYPLAFIHEQQEQ